MLQSPAVLLEMVPGSNIKPICINSVHYFLAKSLPDWTMSVMYFRKHVYGRNMPRPNTPDFAWPVETIAAHVQVQIPYKN